MVYGGLTITLVILGLSAILWSYYPKGNAMPPVKKNIKEGNLDEYYEEYGARIDELNQKILEINEYGGFLKGELDKKHKELLFLYQLIHEKTKDIKENGDYNKRTQSQDTATYINDNAPIEQHVDISVEESEKVNLNQMILELSNKGYSIKEIAQLLEIGQGEVKLVLNLYE